MERIYNKLVRDKIPFVITENGETAVTRILDETAYKTELEKKLHEEYREVIEAEGDERLEELADMLEVIRALAKATGKSWYDVYTGVSLDGYQLADMMSNNPNLRKLVKTIDLELNEEKETR